MKKIAKIFTSDVFLEGVEQKANQWESSLRIKRIGELKLNGGLNIFSLAMSFGAIG